MNFLVTGGAGFIGSAVVRLIINDTNHSVLNIDKLTYAGNLQSLLTVSGSDRYQFEQIDICNSHEVDRIFRQYHPDVVMHLAAETHVDRSIGCPAEFIQTNIVGTYTLLEVARKYWKQLKKEKQSSFRFHHISTDEVYGDLQNPAHPFTESTRYAPGSPYAASKASSDHLVRAWTRTYGLPSVISNSSNNYGPYQFPEKLIPLTILNAIKGKPLPVYGDGKQIRDWLYVEDHARALYLVASKGEPGETYNIGGNNEMANIDVVKTVCLLLEETVPDRLVGMSCYEDLITFVEDRPGHDEHYAINADKIERELGWKPKETFETGVRKTIEWYLSNKEWWSSNLNEPYSQERLVF